MISIMISSSGPIMIMLIAVTISTVITMMIGISTIGGRRMPIVCPSAFGTPGIRPAHTQKDDRCVAYRVRFGRWRHVRCLSDS